MKDNASTLYRNMNPIMTAMIPSNIFAAETPAIMLHMENPSKIKPIPNAIRATPAIHETAWAL